MSVVPASSRAVPQSSQADLRSPVWNPWDMGCMAAGFGLCLLLSWMLGRGRMFWEDEMLGWMLLTDPSWHHMVAAWKAGADGGGFAFYVTGRAWLRVLGPSEVAFRMYSAVCFGLAFVCTWLAARKFYGRWIVGFALFGTFFCDKPLVLHLGEGRFYGLLTLTVALVLLCTLTLTGDHKATGRATRAGWSVLLVTAHALLTTSHLLGVVYSAFLLASLMAVDRHHHRARPLLYLTVAATWLLLLPELPAIRASAAVGKPWFWTTPPGFRRFLGVYGCFSPVVLVVLALAIAAAGWSLWRQRGRPELTQRWRVAFEKRYPLYAATLALFLVPAAFFAEGRFGPSIFIDRYLLPVALGTALLLAEAFWWIDWDGLLPGFVAVHPGAPQRVRIAAACGMVLFLGVWDAHTIPPWMMERHAYAAPLVALLPAGATVLTEDAFTFTELVGREHSGSVQFLYPLDWRQTVSDAAPRLEVTQYNLMRNWQRVGYFSGSIVDLEPFLARTPAFFVIDSNFARDSIIGDPLADRLAHTPGYRVSRYATLARSDGPPLTIDLVRHDPGTTVLPVLRAPGQNH